MPWGFATKLGEMEIPYGNNVKLSMDDAKAAAQADYEQRILSALSVDISSLTASSSAKDAKIAELTEALLMAKAYMSVSLGSPSWTGDNPYPIIDAALADTPSSGHAAYVEKDKRIAELTEENERLRAGTKSKKPDVTIDQFYNPFKKLEWDASGSSHSIIGTYRIDCMAQGGVYGLILPADDSNTFPYSKEGSEADCRSSAQAHFNATIASVLHYEPISAQAENCARISRLENGLNELIVGVEGMAGLAFDIKNLWGSDYWEDFASRLNRARAALRNTEASK
jgi:hypothetical protein